jgi:hypothetical protein
MNKSRVFSAAIAAAIVITFAASTAHSQGGPNVGRRPRMYNPASEITVKGKVQAVAQTQGTRAGGVVVGLVTETETFQVILAPEWFLDEKNFKPSKGDELQVTGSKARHQGHAIIIARKVSMQGKEVILRNPKGIPEWFGKTPPKS